MKNNIFIQVNKSNLRPRQMKVNTVTRLRQAIKHLRQSQEAADKTELKMKVTATRSSLQVNQSNTENEMSLIQNLRIQPRQVRVKWPARQRQELKLPEDSNKSKSKHQRHRVTSEQKNTHEGWDKSELVSQNQMITALRQFWTKYWL